MEMIGEKYKTDDVFIPEVLLSARAMNEALPVFEPCLANGKKEVTGRVLMGTVRRDIRVQNRPAGIIRSIDDDKARDEKDNSVIGCQRSEEHH